MITKRDETTLNLLGATGIRGPFGQDLAGVAAHHHLDQIRLAHIGNRAVADRLAVRKNRVIACDAPLSMAPAILDGKPRAVTFT